MHLPSDVSQPLSLLVGSVEGRRQHRDLYEPSQDLEEHKRDFGTVEVPKCAGPPGMQAASRLKPDEPSASSRPALTAGHTAWREIQIENFPFIVSVRRQETIRLALTKGANCAFHQRRAMGRCGPLDQNGPRR